MNSEALAVLACVVALPAGFSQLVNGRRVYKSTASTVSMQVPTPALGVYTAVHET